MEIFMKRRTFLATLAMTIPFVATGCVGLGSPGDARTPREGNQSVEILRKQARDRRRRRKARERRLKQARDRRRRRQARERRLKQARDRRRRRQLRNC